MAESDFIEEEQKPDPEPQQPTPPEIWDSIPPGPRRRTISSISYIAQIGRPPGNPMLDRVNPEHITQLLNHAEAQSRRDSDLEKSHRRYQFAYFAVTLLSILFLIVFFAIVEKFDILAAIITGVAGLGAGFGIGKLTDRH